jgi:hypothetical protein
MKVTINGKEVDFSKLKDYVTEDTFDNEMFSKKLNNFKSVLEDVDLKKVDEISRKETRQDLKMVNALSLINKRLEEHNYTDKYNSNTIEEVKKLIQIKVKIDEYPRLNKNEYIKIPNSGIFTVVGLYIVPFSLIESFDTDFEVFNHINAVTYKQFNPYHLPSDALLGSSRRISKTHFAIIRETEEIHRKYLNRSNAWRYISSFGEEV